tara:strand:- start:466 stop:663 length:198 start_codon:yes stop_codon:yes gene_type:complete
MNKPDTSSMDYKYGIFHCINRKYSPSGRYWTNEQIKNWCDKNDVYYEDTDKRVDLIERIKQAGYK